MVSWCDVFMLFLLVFGGGCVSSRVPITKGRSPPSITKPKVGSPKLGYAIRTPFFEGGSWLKLLVEIVGLFMIVLSCVFVLLVCLYV